MYLDVEEGACMKHGGVEQMILMRTLSGSFENRVFCIPEGLISE
jgi:hypothetical protein